MAFYDKRSITLALRIHFNGHHGFKVSTTTQDNIDSLLPWLRSTLSSLRLPHPKSQNVIKPHEATSFIDMYWDVEIARVRYSVLQALTQIEHGPLAAREFIESSH
jgi:hypothetical protein